MRCSRKEERAASIRGFYAALIDDFNLSPRRYRDRINGEVARRMRDVTGPAEERDAARKRVLINVLKRERATGRLKAPRHHNPTHFQERERS